MGKIKWGDDTDPLETDNQAHIARFSGHYEIWLYFLARS